MPYLTDMYELAHVTTLSSPIEELIRVAYSRASQFVELFHALGSEEYKESDSNVSARLRTSLHRYSIDNGLLYYRTDVADTARIVVPHHEDLEYRILFETHVNAPSARFWREKDLWLCGSTLPVDQTLQMGEHVRAYMRHIPEGQILGIFGCATRRFTCAQGVLGVHQYGFHVWSFQRL